MQKIKFRAWLEKQEKQGGGPFAPGTVDQYIRDADKVEKGCGDLDELYAKDCLAEVLQKLEYAATARKRDRPNPKGLHGPGYKYAVNAYRKFCEGREPHRASRVSREVPGRSRINDP